jgi:urea transport system permease protein
MKQNALTDLNLLTRRPLYSGRVWAALAAAVALLALLPLLNLAFPPGHALHVSAYAVALLGKFMCYAMAALALDLVWGYAGILSLGHGLFFALGGYAHGMYLMRAIGRDGVYQSDLPDFMVFLDWKSYPWYWSFTEHFWYAMLLVVLVPGVLAFVFGYFAFRSRIKGVYFSIITQALTFAAMLLFFRNDTGFGGNNGFTDFKRILGFDITAPGTRAALYWITLAALAGALVLARAVTQSKLGRVLTAVRDAESRLRFIGYDPLGFKLFVWTLSAVLCGIAGALYVPQVGIINPSEMSTETSIEMVIWVATGGRGTLVGPIIGAGAVNGLKTWFTSVLPEFWLYALDLRAGDAVPAHRHRRPGAPRLRPHPGEQGMSSTPIESAALDGGPSGDAGYGRVSPKGLDTSHGAILYLEGITVSFDGFKALNDLTLDIGVGELRCIIGPNGAGKTTMMDVITGKTRPTSGTAYFGQRPQVPAAHGVRAAQRVRKPGAGDEDRQARAAHAVRAIERRTGRQDRRDAGPDPVAARSGVARGAAVARPEAVAGDRHAADAGAAIAAAGRAGGGHDRCRDRTHRRAAQRIARTPFADGGGARHGFRQSDRGRRQGHGAARRLGAGRRADEQGAGRSAGHRSLSGALRCWT